MTKRTLVRLLLAVILLPLGSPLTAQTPSNTGYLLGPEDILEISVWKEDGLTREVLIRPDGKLSFPLVGDVQAAGKSVTQLTDDLTKGLTRYIAAPTVTISVRQVRGNKIYVIGKVNKPGEYATGRYVDVMQILSMAGGLSTFAKEEKIKILRREGGVLTAILFNYAEVALGENLKQNIILKNGDVVVVP